MISRIKSAILNICLLVKLALIQHLLQVSTDAALLTATAMNRYSSVVISMLNSPPLFGVQVDWSYNFKSSSALLYLASCQTHVMNLRQLSSKDKTARALPSTRPTPRHPRNNARPTERSKLFTVYASPILHPLLSRFFYGAHHPTCRLPAHLTHLQVSQDEKATLSTS